MAPEQITAQKLKKAYYLTQKIPDQVGDYLPPPTPSASRKLPYSNIWNQFFFCLGQGFLV